MELMLEVISRHKFSAEIKPSHIFSEVGGYIGRSNESDWMLPDRLKRVSRKHVLISSDGQDFYLEDLSSNGILMTLTRELIGRDSRHKVVHGESFQVGDYVVQARLLGDPASYSPQVLEGADGGVIPDNDFLDLDPLVAMEQQEFYNARRRLGLYDDLISDEFQPSHDVVSNHNPAGLDAMLAVRAIPEDVDLLNQAAKPKSQLSGRPDSTWTGAALETEPPLNPALPALEEEKAGRPVNFSIIPEPPERETVHSPEVDIFFEALGLEKIPEEQIEREALLLKAADLLKASLEGLIHSLQNRAASKNELRLPITTVQLTGNNPLKFSPTAQAAMNRFFGDGMEGSLTPLEAVYRGFDELHAHHLGILAGSRAAMSAVLERISPQKIQERLDTAGTVKFKREPRLWQTFVKMHNELQVHDGLSDFFYRDFARAYEMQQQTLKPVSENKRDGEQL